MAKGSKGNGGKKGAAASSTPPAPAAEDGFKEPALTPAVPKEEAAVKPPIKINRRELPYFVR